MKLEALNQCNHYIEKKMEIFLKLELSLAFMDPCVKGRKLQLLGLGLDGQCCE